MDDSSARRRRLLGAMVLLLVMAIGSAYAVTLIIGMNGNTLYGNHGRSFHTALRTARGLQYITTGIIDLEGHTRHYQQVYLVLARDSKAPAKILAAHVYGHLRAGGWPHEINAYVQSTWRHGNMYVYKAMHGPDGKFVWVAAMRHGRVVNLISYTGRHLDLPLDEHEFGTLTQWVHQNQAP
ncbi:MAG: hypothetical protein ACP5I8_01085 [Phycisphaerae bacterium]